MKRTPSTRGARGRTRGEAGERPRGGAGERTRGGAGERTRGGAGERTRGGAGERTRGGAGERTRGGAGRRLRQRSDHPASARPAESVLRSQPWDLLLPHLPPEGASGQAALAKTRRFAELLISWNHNVSNIISRNDEPRLVVRHLLESVEPAHWLKECGATRWLDFGSGAGLPAIPLAIAGVGDHWTLVESRRRKTLFARKAVEELGLKGVIVVCARLERLREEAALGPLEFDGFTSRATLPLGPTLALASSYVVPGGTAFLWKGSRREEEMAADPRWKEHWEPDGLLGLHGGQTFVARFRRKQSG